MVPYSDPDEDRAAHYGNYRMGYQKLALKSGVRFEVTKGELSIFDKSGLRIGSYPGSIAKADGCAVVSAYNKFRLHFADDRPGLDYEVVTTPLPSGTSNLIYKLDKYPSGRSEVRMAYSAEDPSALKNPRPVELQYGFLVADNGHTHQTALPLEQMLGN